MLGRLGTVVYWVGCALAVPGATYAFSSAFDDSPPADRLGEVAWGLAVALVFWLPALIIRNILRKTHPGVPHAGQDT